MSTIRWPSTSESEHPQYLWNEHEYIMRMLTQNSIGVGFNEDNDYVHIWTLPQMSMNHIANGPVNFPTNYIQGYFDTWSNKFIYIKADGTQFYESYDKPTYNQYLHGWYHKTKADRAILFVNPSESEGARGILLDSPNSLFEIDMIGMGSWELYTEINEVSDWRQRTLQPGLYRIQISGGRGGKGGDIENRNNPVIRYPAYGGQGALGATSTIILRILGQTDIFCYRGGDGEAGQNGGAVYYTYVFALDNPILLNPGSDEAEYQYNAGGFNGAAVSGGGGSSGEDSVIKLNDIDIVTARGGAGGGGAPAIIQSATGIYMNMLTTGFMRGETYAHGPGGGGAGSGAAQNGNLPANAPINPGVGCKGTLMAGGQPGNGTFAYYDYQSDEDTGILIDPLFIGKPGQNIDAGNRRNGGDSGEVTLIYNNREYKVSAKGGQNTLSTSQGYIRIYKIGEVHL